MTVNHFEYKKKFRIKNILKFLEKDYFWREVKKLLMSVNQFIK